MKHWSIAGFAVWRFADACEEIQRLVCSVSSTISKSEQSSVCRAVLVALDRMQMCESPLGARQRAGRYLDATSARRRHSFEIIPRVVDVTLTDRCVIGYLTHPTPNAAYLSARH